MEMIRKYNICYMYNVVNFKILLIIFATCLTFLQGCVDSHDNPNSGDVKLIVFPSLASGISVTRGLPIVITDSVLSTTTNTSLDFGFWLTEDSSKMVEYSNGMANMKATYRASNSDKWTYNYGGTEHYVLSAKPYNSLDFYAYYPYFDNVDDPCSIPFNTGNDLLWAKIHVETKEPGTFQNIDLRFEHIMACIHLKINLKYLGSSTKLNSLNILDNDSTNISNLPLLYTKGYLDLTDGSIELRDKDICSHLSFNNLDTYFQNDPKRYISIYIPIIPVDGYRNNRFTLEFNIDNEKKSCGLPSIGGKEYLDFKRGYMYNYEVTLDNEMIIRAMSVDKDWHKYSENINFVI